jgi:plasmid stabilization system protein ParE
MKKKIVVADRAVNSFRRIVTALNQESLIGGEDARTAILNKIRTLGTNPERNSRRANFEKLEGNYRSVQVWDYRIYYKVENERIVILDLMLDIDSKIHN